MSPQTALLVLAWVAIVVLYLGMAALLRELRMLRRSVTRGPGGPGRSARTIRLRGLPEASTGDERLVLVVDSQCPLCAACLEELPALAARTSSRPVVLHEGALRSPSAAVTYYSDAEDLGSFAHLSPPVLALVGPRGDVRDLALVNHPSELAAAAQSWGLATVDDRSSHGSQV